MKHSIAFGLLCIIAFIGTAAAWSTLNAAPGSVVPSIRTWPAVGSMSNGFVVFGGVYDDFNSNNYVFYDDTYFYNQETNTFSQLTVNDNRKPAPRAFSSGVGNVATNKMYIYGGAFYNAYFTVDQTLGDFWEFDLNARKWTELDNCHGPRNRTGSSLTIVGDTLYLFGGLGPLHEGLNDLWAYDLTANAVSSDVNGHGYPWRQILPANLFGTSPTKQQYAFFQHYNGKLYLGAGERGIETFFGFAPQMWAFDLATRLWSAVLPTQNYSPSRNYVGDILYNGYLILAGGDTPSPNPPCCGAPFPQNPTADTWLYNFNANAFHLAVNSPTPTTLKRHRAVAVGNQAYLIGGWSWVQGLGQIWNPNVYVQDLDALIAQY